MFKRLKLTNFRKHTDLTVDFQQGLIAVRGLNEAGKSTLQEAIAYALFGSKGLRQPLAEVVTWGQAEASLKVVLELDGGMIVSRSKRGAEIGDAAANLICTGQTEVTKYVEQMLGANADVAGKMMLASQGALRGALEGGPAEAAQLIEKLADFDLIDRVVDLVQRELPTGNTAAVEEMLRAAEARLAETVTTLEPTTELSDRVEHFNAEYGEIYENQKALSTKLNAFDPAGMRRWMQELQKLEHARDVVLGQIDDLEPQVHVDIVTLDVPPARIQAWRDSLAAEKNRDEVRRAYAAFKALQVPETMWEGTKNEFEAELHAQAAEIHRLSTLVSELTSDARAVLLRKINEKACAFCGKDLTDVPEVLLRNAEADAQYLHLTHLVLGHQALLRTMQAEYDEMQAVGKVARQYEEAASRISPYTIWRADRRYPAEISWKGEVPTDVPAPPYAAMIAEAEAAQAVYQRAVGARDGAIAQMAALTKKRDALVAELAPLLAEAPAVSERIRDCEALERDISAATKAMEETRQRLVDARHALELAEQRNAAARLARATVEVSVENLRKQLDGMRFNNALLKKVRAARPYISDKLWTIVLASVSHHFSIIRGTASVITRSDNGFRCDGQAVQGLSGSTLDALGLAIRIALTKTFLPNSTFLMLDEPGAAADSEREGNMLGLLAASDFQQVLLVTHSDLADSFASQVVQL